MSWRHHYTESAKMMRVIYTGSFVAKDSQGNSYTIHKYNEFPAPDVPAVLRLETDGGKTVQCVSKGLYETVGQGLKLKSDDPKAP
jgi:hypothetical protein